ARKGLVPRLRPTTSATSALCRSDSLRRRPRALWCCALRLAPRLPPLPLAVGELRLEHTQLVQHVERDREREQRIWIRSRCDKRRRDETDHDRVSPVSRQELRS